MIGKIAGGRAGTYTATAIMTTLAEIEAAVENLARPEQAALLDFVVRQLQSGGERPRRPRRELLAKWRAQGSGLIERHGGAQAYLNAIRGLDENEDGR